MNELKLEDKSVSNMWKSYLECIGDNIETTSKTYTSWHFCNDEKSANNLANLVKKGIKKGTASLYDLYKISDEDIPKEDEYSVIINWDGIAKCIIKNKKVYILPFKDVDERLAFIEGEGDKSLNYWRRVHIDYFKNELLALNMEFNEDMLVVFEEFEVVY